MGLGYGLAIEQSQKLVVTHKLIQAIKILQYSSQELGNFVDEQLLTNPILEFPSTSSGISDSPKTSDIEKLSEDFESDFTDKNYSNFDYFKEIEYDDISYVYWKCNTEKNEYYANEQYASTGITLTEYLMSQLRFAPIKGKLKALCRHIIESLDENGYMTLTIDNIAEELGITQNIVRIALKTIQSFEPAGVAARNLKECLLIQLKRNGTINPMAKVIVNNYLKEIAGNRLNYIAKALHITTNEVQEICDVIKKLEPKPGRCFKSADETVYIVPDVVIEKIGSEYLVTVNESSAPRLNISPYYRKMLNEAEKESNISKFLICKLNSALWLIKSIEQRRQTINKVVSAVLKYQIDFFEMGPKYLKALTFQQIADEVGIHESTVSRAINGKYIQTPRGLFEIRYFFTNGVSDKSGDGISSESIKILMKEIIRSENPKSPLSDQAIAEQLLKRGVNISRRTVAKYRDTMNLPSYSKRKRY